MKLIYRCICMVLGAILGSGCSNSMDPPEYGVMPEYGVPTGTINITGRVVDDQGAPISGVQVSFQGAGADTTDAQGGWAIHRENDNIPCDVSNDTNCTIEAEDIDGPANGGTYAPSEVVLDLEQTDPGSGSYDLGTWEQHDIDVVMTEVKPRKPRD